MEILDLNEDTLKFYKECFDKNELPKEEEIIRWQFFENGEKNFVDIEHDFSAEKTAAIYATFGIKFKIDGKIYSGSQSLDTITDINYRGKGLFIKLAKDVYQKSKENDVALVYGFPNANSIHGFVTKLEWQKLDPLPFIIKPLHSKFFTDKIKALRFLPNFSLSYSSFKQKKSLLIKEEKDFPEAVNAIWEKFSKNIKISVHRNKSYLNWRYVMKPGEDYKIVNCYDEKNNYLGFIVYAVKEKHKGIIGYIMELIYDLDNPEAGKQLLNFAVSEIKKQKADCILSWCFEHSPNYQVYKKAFFIKMPEKLRPIILHFAARTFNEKLKTIIENRNNWFISYSDSDTV